MSRAGGIPAVHGGEDVKAAFVTGAGGGITNGFGGSATLNNTIVAGNPARILRKVETGVAQ